MHKHTSLITLSLPPYVNHIQPVNCHATGIEEFRLFVESRDGRWYKQSDPDYFTDENTMHVFCHFGVDDTPSGTPYRIVALCAVDPLPNVLDTLPVERQLSLVTEVIRV